MCEPSSSVSHSLSCLTKNSYAIMLRIEAVHIVNDMKVWNPITKSQMTYQFHISVFVNKVICKI